MTVDPAKMVQRGKQVELQSNKEYRFKGLRCINSIAWYYTIKLVSCNWFR